MDTLPFDDERLLGLRNLALKLPEVVEEPSCNKKAYRARKKGFLFLGWKPEGITIMVKLKDSLAQAEALAADAPEIYKIGKFGWVTLHYPKDMAPPAGLLEGWLLESFRVMMPKTLLKQLDPALIV